MGIADISGKPMVMLGGEDVWLSRTTGDIVCEYKYVEEKPCMVLYREAPTTKTGAFIIEVMDIHKYADNRGNPTMRLIADAARAAASIGFAETDTHAIRRLVTIIIEGVPDLQRMPHMQIKPKNYGKTVGGEMTLKVGDKTIEKEIYV